MNENIFIRQEVYDFSRRHRLRLRYIEELELDYPEDVRGGFNFYSITWEVQIQDWVLKACISESEFRSDSGNRMWICEIHDFSPTTGLARILIGEEIPFGPPGSAYVQYNWREWDLIENVQMNVIQQCGSPHDAFEGF